MATVSRTISAPRHVVFRALVTPQTYPHWLLGCKEIRAVDDAWPAVGTRFHHRVGLFGPLTVADSTKVVAVDEPSALTLEVRFRPIGRAQVTFALDEREASTFVEFEEHPIGGLALLAPLAQPLIAGRNKHSLEQLAAFVEQVAQPTA